MKDVSKGIKMSELEIMNVLVISTSHVTEDDDSLLMHATSISFTPGNWGKDLSASFSAKLPLTVYPFCYGYMAHLPEDLADRKQQILDFGFSEAFCDALLFGQKAGARYLMFDCDGPAYDELKTFDW